MSIRVVGSGGGGACGEEGEPEEKEDHRGLSGDAQPRGHRTAPCEIHLHVYTYMYMAPSF